MTKRKLTIQKRKKIDIATLGFGVSFCWLLSGGELQLWTWGELLLSRLAKAAGAQPAAQISDENLHAVVTQSTFPSQNFAKLTASGHFWKLRCPKSACRCGAKHMSESTVQKMKGSGPILTLRCRFAWQAQRTMNRKKWARPVGFVAVSTISATLDYTTSTTTTTTVRYTQYTAIH